MTSPSADRDAMFRFLNSLPTGGEIISWLESFRASLGAFLGDADLVMVDVNYLCDLDDPAGYRPLRAFTQHISAGGDEDVAVELDSADGTHGARLLAQARSNGFPTGEYHGPAIFEYFFGGCAYLGTIILWRNRDAAAISPESLATMRELEPFIIFLLSDIVARHGYRRPVDRAFHQALEGIAEQIGLTGREEEVLALHLFGYPYQRIAGQLHLGIDSVRKYVKSIHRKAGVSTYTELFARYFTPRVFAEQEHDLL
ncbi:MAG: helix-turn-helix transcriptional regulator [Candidatus Kapaibacterium sp.]